jgi:predicted DNA-binding transcriptional regulator AlpA
MNTAENAGETTPRLWSLDETAHYLGKTPSALHTMRWRRIGPPSFKVGRHVRFRPQDVMRWVEEQAALAAAEYDHR